MLNWTSYFFSSLHNLLAVVRGLTLVSGWGKLGVVVESHSVRQTMPRNGIVLKRDLLYKKHRNSKDQQEDGPAYLGQILWSVVPATYGNGARECT